ncbi:DUF1501 domain-containing protein [Nocardioides sp. YIM 152588]|uniref:DUF1501 domain-containing protein n=1 Tax=Nocardioides sp. YIM 152588 TaxID=3158259 RepID=UPI0032E52A14
MTTDLPAPPPDPTPGRRACAEFGRAARLSRRRFLGAAASAVAMTTVFGSVVRETAFAASSGGNVMVVLSMRGGLDGLGLVVPHGDAGYYAARPRIGVPVGALLEKDAMFGLHPSLAALAPLFASGRLAAVHAAGLPVPNRSHFEAMELIEDADPTSSERRGWVNRMSGLSAPDHAVVHLTSTIEPTLVTGPAPALAVKRLDDVRVVGADGDPAWSARRLDQLRTVWGSAEGPLADAGRSVLRTIDTVGPVAQRTYQPTAGVTYPSDWPAVELSTALRDTARLIKADIGTEVVNIDYGSWDMHAGYGTTEWGSMQAMNRGFADALAAFLADLAPVADRVTVVTISEFGRRVDENGSGGLDHGWGNVMLVAGGGVKGGRYYGSWPGLAPAGSTQGTELAVTTDFRDVLGEIATKRLGASIATAFPGHSYNPLGVIAT